MRCAIIAALGVVLLSPRASAARNEKGCIANTGAFCIRACNPSRGDGTCQYGRCFCHEGSCAGSDEICHAGAAAVTTDIADGTFYKIYNSRWPEYAFFASAHGPLVARTDGRTSGDKAFQWTMTTPPVADADRPPTFLVHSRAWPDAVMMLKQHIACSTTNYANLTEEELAGAVLTEEELTDIVIGNENGSLPEGWQVNDTKTADEYDDPENFIHLGETLAPEGGGRRLSSRRRSYSSTNCREVRHPMTMFVQGGFYGFGTDPPMADMVLSLQKAPAHWRPNGEQLVMIANSQNSYIFLSSTSIRGFAGWGCRGYHQDPGAGGYWYFNPPLPDSLWDSLPTYTGQTCDFDCGLPAATDAHFLGSANPSKLGTVALALALGTSILAVLPRA